VGFKGLIFFFQMPKPQLSTAIIDQMRG